MAVYIIPTNYGVQPSVVVGKCRVGEVGVRVGLVCTEKRWLDPTHSDMFSALMRIAIFMRRDWKDRIE